jgi:hypothetical protein
MVSGLIKFESLKKMNLKRIFLKEENPFSFPLSLFPAGPSLSHLLSTAREPPWAAGLLLSRERVSGPAGPARPSAGPARPAPFFFSRQTLAGGAWPSGPPPTSSRWLAAPQSWPSAVTGRVCRSPAFKPMQSSAVKLPPSFPLINRPVPLLNLSPP